MVGGFSEIGITVGFGKESFGKWVVNGSIGVCLGFGYLVLGSGFHGMDGRKRLWWIGGAGSFWVGGVYGGGGGIFWSCSGVFWSYGGV